MEQLKVGRRLYLKLQNTTHDAKSLAKKLAARCLDRNLLFKRLCTLAYKLDLPSSSKISHVFMFPIWNELLLGQKLSPTVLEKLHNIYGWTGGFAGCTNTNFGANCALRSSRWLLYYSRDITKFTPQGQGETLGAVQCNNASSCTCLDLMWWLVQEVTKAKGKKEKVKQLKILLDCLMRWK